MKRMMMLVLVAVVTFRLAALAADFKQVPGRQIPNKILMTSPTANPKVLETLKKWTDFVTNACSDGYYYTYPQLADGFESINIWECNNCAKGINEGSTYWCRLPSWANKEKIVSSYVCSQGYPIPENPCPTGFELKSDGKKVGQNTPVYGCRKIGQITKANVDQWANYKAKCAGSFHGGLSGNGGLNGLWCKDDYVSTGTGYSDEYKKCIAENSQSGTFYASGEYDFNALKSCCNEFGLDYWCYADQPKNEVSCGTSGAKLIGEGTSMFGLGQGACCVFTEEK